MTKVFKVNGGELPDGAVLMEGGKTSLPGGVAGLAAAAWYGEAVSSGISIDDPDGDIEVQGFQTFTVDETASTGTERQWSGWITARHYQRGPYKHGPGRIISCDIVEINHLWSLEVFRANSAQRPAETDVERMQWVITSGPMAGTPIVDNGRLSTANPAGLTSADFVRQYPGEVLNSSAGQTAKNGFAYWDHDEDEISISYEPSTAWPVSTLSISNDMTDVGTANGGTGVDDDCFFPFLDSDLARDPQGVYTGTLLDWVGGSTYGRRQSTIDALSPTPFSPINFLRDQIITSQKIGRATTAATFVETYLDFAANEADTILVSIRVPPEKVGLISHGMRLPMKGTHIAPEGYGDFVEMPVVRCNKVPTAGRTDTWDVHLELSNAVKIRETDGGDPDDLPHGNPCDVANVSIVQTTHTQLPAGSFGQAVDAAWDVQPTEGNILIAAWLLFGNATADVGDMPGWTKDPDLQQISQNGSGGSSGAVNIFYKVAEAGEDMTPGVPSVGVGTSNMTNSQIYLIEVAGVDTFDLHGTPQENITTADYSLPITPTAGKVAILLGFMTWGTSFTTEPVTPKTGSTELWHEGNMSDGGNPRRIINYRIVDGTTGSYDVGSNASGSGTQYGGVALAFYCSGSENTCPKTGQWVLNESPPEVPDGVITTFTTNCPFTNGSLRVRYDTVDQTPAILSQDGENSTYTMSGAPITGQQVFHDYQGI